MMTTRCNLSDAHGNNRFVYKKGRLTASCRRGQLSCRLEENGIGIRSFYAVISRGVAASRQHVIRTTCCSSNNDTKDQKHRNIALSPSSQTRNISLNGICLASVWKLAASLVVGAHTELLPKESSSR